MHAVVAHIERLAAPLISVTENADCLSLKQRQIAVLVKIPLCHVILRSWFRIVVATRKRVGKSARPPDRRLGKLSLEFLRALQIDRTNRESYVRRRDRTRFAARLGRHGHNDRYTGSDE